MEKLSVKTLDAKEMEKIEAGSGPSVECWFGIGLTVLGGITADPAMVIAGGTYGWDHC